MKNRWFVESKDDHTKEMLSRLRPGEKPKAVEVALPGNITKKVEAWQVSFANLTFLEGSKNNKLNYLAYGQEGDGPIRPHLFLLKKVTEQKRRAALKATARQRKKLNE